MSEFDALQELADLTPVTVSPERISLARADALEQSRPLLDVLQEQLQLSADQFVSALGASLGMPVLTMWDLHRLSPAFDLLPYNEVLQRHVLAFRDEENQMLVALADPFTPEVQAWAEERMRQPFVWHLAHRDDILAFLASYEETQRAMDSVLMGDDGGALFDADVIDISLKSIAEDSSPVVKLVNSTLYDALKSDVSDIHLECVANGLAIKYRIDGVLTAVGSVPGQELAEQVVSRLKVMSELDIAERRIPQDGRFKVLVGGRDVDFRVSVIPSLHGEDAVLRILDKKAVADEMRGLRLDMMGLDDYTIGMVRRMSQEPYGMVLVTGPTGSGKTTTLYAAISEINHGEDKIITIEDPVEYQLAGVLQIPVNEKKGLTFARGLRAILRHDPDKIMVGEIRDSETAQIAVQAALTGHLVFTTVHANSIFDVLGRFMHMGVEPYSFVAALNGIVAQRLVRVSCTQCLEPDQPDPQLLRESGLHPDGVKDWVFQKGKGCTHCRGTGFKGRKAIAEVLHLNDALRELIAARAPLSQLKEAARAHGTRFLRQVSLSLVRQGHTTLTEVNRVTFVE